MARHDDTRGVGELLAAVAANVAAVPVVIGFVALGGVVMAGRAVADLATHALTSRDGRRKSAKPRTPQEPASR